jgi:hypothetical protein
MDWQRNEKDQEQAGNLERKATRFRALFVWSSAFGVSKFKLEVQRTLFVAFAPEGRDVYSLAVLSLLQSSVGAQSLFPFPAKVPLPGFAPNGARSSGVRSAITISILWSEKEFNCCTCKLNAPFPTEAGTPNNRPDSSQPADGIKIRYSEIRTELTIKAYTPARTSSAIIPNPDSKPSSRRIG